MELHNLESLTDEDRQMVAAWEELFTSFGWELLMRRFGPRLDGTVSDMDGADSLLDLGRAQGCRTVLRELVDLEMIIEAEFDTAYQAESWEDV